MKILCQETTKRKNISTTLHKEPADLNQLMSTLYTMYLFLRLKLEIFLNLQLPKLKFQIIIMDSHEKSHAILISINKTQIRN